MVSVTFGPLPALVRARLTALFATDARLTLPPGDATAAVTVRVLEWSSALAIADRTTPAVLLLPPGVSAPADAGRAAQAWLPMDAPDAMLLAAVHAVAAGLAVTAAAEPSTGATRPRVEDATDTSLTDRELDVLKALADGLVNKEIAARLGISSSTVKFHLQAIFAKLGVRTRAEAVSQGLRRGVVPL